VQLPPQADPGAAPDWQKRSDGHRVTWRDHRVRWEGADPPSVKANPGQAQTVVSRWTVPLFHGPDSVVVTGRISWVPGPAAAPWLLSIVVLFVATFAAGATRWWARLLSSALALLIAVDVVRLFGAATQAGGSVVGGLVNALLFGILEVMAWAAGVWAIGAIQERRAMGLYAAMAVGIVIVFVSGVGDLLNLAYSQVPTSLPTTAARAAVVVCLGVGFGLIGGSFLALRKLGAAPGQPAPAGLGRV